jgi:hypothetical protein
MRRTIALFDVTRENTVINRYAPFLLQPQARYSLGVIRWDGGAKITAMRNPWWDFPSIPLGEIFANHGGGGHNRVASLIVASDQLDKVAHILGELAEEILRREERQLRQPNHERQTELL